MTQTARQSRTSRTSRNVVTFPRRQPRTHIPSRNPASPHFDGVERRIEQIRHTDQYVRESTVILPTISNGASVFCEAFHDPGCTNPASPVPASTSYRIERLVRGRNGRGEGRMCRQSLTLTGRPAAMLTALICAAEAEFHADPHAWVLTRAEHIATRIIPILLAALDADPNHP